MYVAISRTLLAIIAKRIDNLRTAEVEAEKEPASPGAVQVKDHVWLRQALWGPLYNTEFEGIPELTYDNERTVHVKFEDGTARDSAVTVHGIPKHRLVNKNTYYLEDPKIMVPNPDVFAFFVEQASYRKRVEECNERWKKIAVQVEDFLNKCKSLNEALKLWPDLSYYVPDDYKKRVEKKVEKSERDSSEVLKALQAIDKETVTMSNVIARMSQAAESTA